MLEAIQSDAEWDETLEFTFQGDVARRFRPTRKPAQGCESVAFALDAHEALIEYAGC